MSEFIAITFKGEGDAAAAAGAIQSLQAAGKLEVADIATVVKDAEGKVHRKDTAASGTQAGAVFGAVMGVLLFLIFPVAGLVGGAVVGGLVGRSLAPGIDGAFVKGVADDLQPGGSALFVLLKTGDAGLIVAAMRPFEGTIRQTSLPEDIEVQLAKALE
jgi:uncharacterized membrane protein